VGTAGLTADAGTIDRLRDSLAGFTAHNVQQLAGAGELAAAAAGNAAGALRATRGGGPLAALVRLFLLGVDVEVAAAEEALAPLGVAGFARAGLLEAAASGVKARLRLTPTELCGQQLIVAHDPPARDGVADTVLGVGPTTRSLAQLTFRHPVERALDLGSGGGVQSLLLAAHAGQVVATDLVPRAVELCCFNVALNGIANVECRTGDRFEPVHGERFGLIVSNPPFIVSPDTTFRFRDGGMPLDGMARSVVRGAGEHLTPLGYAQVMACWPNIGGEAWHERVHGWVVGTGCDAWALQLETQQPGDYARRWLAHGADRDPAAYGRWLDHYAEAGIESFGYGIVLLRRVEHRAPWWRFDEAPQSLVGRPAEGLRAGFEAADWLLSHDDESLLAARLAVHEGARLETIQRPLGGGWAAERAVLRHLQGMPFSGAVDQRTAALVAACDGTRTLSEAVATVAEGRPLPERVLEVVRGLIGNGFLVPLDLSSRARS
jgi:methylase of polypeptide subunit release factors